jgi:hypothetical protein
MNEEMSAPGLLRAAARLVDKAMAKLNATSAPCTCCDLPLYENVDHARVWQQLNELPKRLKEAAERLDRSVFADGSPRQQSRGYTAARARLLERNQPTTGGNVNARTV